MVITESIVSNVRVAEDTIWLILFTVMMLMAFKYSAASFGGVRVGYLTFIIAGLSGFFWKGIGWYSRVFDVKEPELLFGVIRELFEGTTGAIFTLACVILAGSLYSLYENEKSVS